MTETPDHIDPQRTALLVMDFQAGILGRIPDADDLVARVAGAIAVVRRCGGHVGYVRVAFEDADIEAMPSTSSMRARVASAGRAFHADAPSTAIDGRIAPAAGDIVVRKIRVGAFSTTDLGAQLRARGIDTLLLAGISTSGVVLSTVRDAADRDYRMLVLEDGSADPDPEVHTFLMQTIFPRQCEVIAIADLEGLLASGS
jgi:nicotinamidase-related amidase